MPQGKVVFAGLNQTGVLVFMCHHGSRSHAAAEAFLQRGFKRVYNVVGGIDAWSREVDSSVREPN